MADRQPVSSQDARAAPLALIAALEGKLAQARKHLVGFSPQEVEHLMRELDTGCASLRAVVDAARRQPGHLRALGSEFLHRAALAATHTRAVMTSMTAANAYQRARLDALMASANAASPDHGALTYDPAGNRSSSLASLSRTPYGAA